MEAAIEKAGFEVDVTREDCHNKRNKFFECVLEKKSELTKSIANDQWKNYYNSVNRVQMNCFAEKGLEKCSPFFNLADIKY